MSGVKITRFLGIFPKQSPELLPDTAAQIARNCKLDSGDIIPYPQGVVRANSGNPSDVRTLYALRDPVTGENVWLSWGSEVDIAVLTDVGTTEQRFYYTGDGAPKVSNFRLAATLAAPPYPAQFYDLGLPLPTDDLVLVATEQPFSTKTSATIARDSTGLATITTTANHELRTGQRVTITGFTFLEGTYSRTGTTVTVTIIGHGFATGEQVGLDFISGDATDGFYTATVTGPNTFTVSDPASGNTSGSVRLTIASFNAPSVEVIVVNPTTFTYNSPGPIVGAISNSQGRIDLGGNPQARTYVFTWITPWSEESVASKPSASILVREGTPVLVTGLPQLKPPGNNFVRGVRLYRTLPSLSGTEYFRLQTFWFPTKVRSASRTSGVVTAVLEFPHNKVPGERIRIESSTNPALDGVFIVLDTLDDFRLTYAQAGSDGDLGVGSTTTMYHDVAQTNVDPARWWGYAGDYDFLDDFDSLVLNRVLGSDEFDPPPGNLTGLIALPNAVLAGFEGNTVYFSEPAQPHAWPREYALSLEYPIRALAAIGGGLFVATEKYPYYISGTDPRVMQAQRIDANYPCLSRRSLVLTNSGIIYATHDGLAVFTPGGTQLITRVMYTDDTWKDRLDPTTIRAVYYGEGYLASHSSGGFRFEPDPQTGGTFVDLDLTFSAAVYEPRIGKAFYASGTSGDILEWDATDQPPMEYEWKSKTLVTQDMLNLGAARVIADYGVSSPIWDEVADLWNTTAANWVASGDLVFRMWVNKDLIFQKVVSDSGVFRLPTGYRSDTFEFALSGDVRVRAVHLAETPMGLRGA
jgi:hypothetical protein